MSDDIRYKISRVVIQTLIDCSEQVEENDCKNCKYDFNPFNCFGLRVADEISKIYPTKKKKSRCVR